MLRFIFFQVFFRLFFRMTEAGGGARFSQGGGEGSEPERRARPAPSEMTGSAPRGAAGHSPPLHIYRSGCRGAN